jgi:glycosyltransferase involved in cell wall biosynthesis
MSHKLLFVVHRYPPYGVGGSEYNVQRIAEQAVKEGHDVTVFSEYDGEYNGVTVTTDSNIVFQPFDLIFVHGSCPHQDFVHQHSADIPSPIYYLIVQPSDSNICQYGMQHATWIGYGTSFDYAHIAKYGLEHKGREFVYGIDTSIEATQGFKDRYAITTSLMYLTVGGFWPHKQHKELAEIFRRADPFDTTLVCMGYDTRFGQPPMQSHNVVVIYGADQQEVFNAMLESNLLILNSTSEGYGLVLLEAMYYMCPWLSTDVAAAHDLHELGYGTIYHSDEELERYLKGLLLNVMPPKFGTGEEMQYVADHHSMAHSLKSLLSVLEER